MRGFKFLVGVWLVAILPATFYSTGLAQGCPVNEQNAVRLDIPLTDIYIVATGDNVLDDLAALLGRYFPGKVKRASSVQDIVRIVQGEGRSVDIAIGAHGSPGSFSVGNDSVSSDNQAEKDLKNGLKGKIKTALYFISCRIAQGKTGQGFLDRLASGICCASGMRLVAVTGPENRVHVHATDKKLLIEKDGCSQADCQYIAVATTGVVPSLTEWGLLALGLLLAGGMGYMLYRRRPALRPAAP